MDRDGDGVREDDKGRKISFGLNTNVENNVRQQVGNLIKNDLNQIGIEVNFKPVTFNDLVTSLRDSHQWDMILLGWGSGVPPDPANGKNITTSSGESWMKFSHISVVASVSVARLISPESATQK